MSRLHSCCFRPLSRLLCCLLVAVASSARAADTAVPNTGAAAQNPAFLNGGPASPMQNPVNEGNLAGIYQLAVANDFTIAQAGAQRRADSQQRWLGLAPLLPNVTLRYSTAEIDNDSSGVSLFGATAFINDTKTIITNDTWTLSLSQPLLDIPAWFNFRQGMEQTRQAQVRFALAQQNLLQRSVEAFLAVIRAEANLQASQAQGEALERQLEQMNERFDVGLVAITDVLDAQASYDQAAAQLIRDEGALETAREQLTVITGQPVTDSLWQFRDDFPVLTPEPADSGEWAQFARNNNLDIAVANHAVEVARLGKRSAASDHLPTISLSFSVTDSESDFDQTNFLTGIRRITPNDSETDNLSITLSIPLPSGGRVSAARRQAGANLELQRGAYLDTVRQTSQQTQTAFLQARTNANRVRANERVVASSESAMEAAQIGFEVGTRNIVDVLNAIQTAAAAQRDYKNSILDYVSSVIELKRLAGTLNPGDIYSLNNWLEKPEPATQTAQLP
ncbi:MAG: TolC family outer membrane protein [Pseudomonadales bacterium]|nr:TolC family outer membrane protein [Pseudomonadales bacterium]